MPLMVRWQLWSSWALQIVVAIILLQTLFFKFTGASESVYIFSRLGMEPWGRFASGAAELVAGILILVPGYVPAGAALALVVILGAVVAHLDCTCEFLGLGTKAFLQPDDAQCGCAESRCLYPTLSLSAYEDVSLVDEMRKQSASGCLLNVGGKPGDPRKYLVSLNVYLLKMTTRFYDECWFEEVPASYDWKINGKPNGISFISNNCQQYDCTVTMPPFEGGWFIYDIAMTKTLIPE